MCATQSDNNLIRELLNEIEQLKGLFLQREIPFISIDKATSYLGLSKATIYGYTSKGLIPHYKLQGRRLYFKIDDLNSFILNPKNRRMSNTEIESEAATRVLLNK
jgi:excisionase family DNA binding protein